MTYWYCGQIIEGDRLTLDPNDPGLLFGATIFTTLRIYGGKSIDSAATGYQLHCQRLQSHLGELGWPQPDWQQVREGVKAIERIKPIVRITLFTDGRELITGRDLPPNLPSLYTQGANLSIARGDYYRSLPQLKSGNYLVPWLAKQAAVAAGATDALLINSEGEWLETATGNLWGYSNGDWFTPPLSAGILAGIARSQAIEYLQARGQKVRETRWQPALLDRLTTIAYSNSIVGIVPIVTVRGENHNYVRDPHHPVWEELRQIWA
jgi:4-amino-4-deoxychorismate lyase